MMGEDAVRYRILFTDIEMWSGVLIEELIPLEGVKNQKEAERAFRKWIKDNSDKINYFESTAKVYLVTKIHQP